MPPSKKYTVLVREPISTKGIALLEQHATLILCDQFSLEKVADALIEADAIIIGENDTLSQEMIHAAQKLQIIAYTGAGLPGIDFNYANERGIRIINTPESSTVAVAELVMGLMLAISRHLIAADQSMKADRWEKSRLSGLNLNGKTLGIVGFGRIGREVALRAKAFGMKVVVNQRRPTPELNLELGVENLDLFDLLEVSDYVTIHVPYRPDTIGLIGKEELAALKSTAILINTAHTGIVDENALLEALKQKKLAGACVDVRHGDSKTTFELAKLPNVIATPHISASTQESHEAISTHIAEEMIQIFEEVDPTNLLPLAVVPMDSIVPHESIDQKRVDRLISRLKGEGILANPPIVTSLENRFMVLDGATRTAALRQLGYPHAVVQISTEADGLALNTWYHVIQRIERSELLTLIESIPSIYLEKTDASKASENMFEYGALCYLQFLNTETFLVFPQSGENRLDALNSLTERYIEASYVDRTLDSNLSKLKNEYEEMTALVVFPEYTVNQVRQVTLSGRYFPAGITRFIIPGRILRVNADLKILKSKELSLSEKNRWLYDHLTEKIQGNHLRFYRESVYLLDE